MCSKPKVWKIGRKLKHTSQSNKHLLHPIVPYSNGGSSREQTEQKQSIADCWQWLILSENLFSRTMSGSCCSGYISTSLTKLHRTRTAAAAERNGRKVRDDRRSEKKMGIVGSLLTKLSPYAFRMLHCNSAPQVITEAPPAVESL